MTVFPSNLLNIIVRSPAATNTTSQSKVGAKSEIIQLIETISVATGPAGGWGKLGNGGPRSNFQGHHKLKVTRVPPLHSASQSIHNVAMYLKLNGRSVRIMCRLSALFSNPLDLDSSCVRFAQHGTTEVRSAKSWKGDAAHSL